MKSLKKFWIILPLLGLPVVWASNLTYHFRGRYESGIVYLNIIYKYNNLYVSRFSVLTQNCKVDLHPDAPLDTRVSLNWFPFNFTGPKGGSVAGVLVDPSRKTYLHSNIGWHGVKTDQCELPDASSVLLISI